MDIIRFDKSLTHVRLMNHSECIKCLNNIFNNKYILRNVSAFINAFQPLIYTSVNFCKVLFNLNTYSQIIIFGIKI